MALTPERLATWTQRFTLRRVEPAVSYDHNTKAGNRGDVVKHTALMAALGAVLEAWEGREFLFADTFAGYAHSPLQPGLEWESGIGKIRQVASRTFRQPSLQRWFDWYVAPRPWPHFGTYPGSSVIALDVAESLGKDLRVAAWETSASCVASLMKALGIRKHMVRTRPAKPAEEDVQRACFLFIDPPNQTEHWKRGTRIVQTFLPLAVPNVLVWLPLHCRGVSGNPPPLSKGGINAQGDAPAGYGATQVRWDHQRVAAQPIVGCQLIHRFQLPAAGRSLREAVDEVSGLTWTPAWTVTHS